MDSIPKNPFKGLRPYEQEDRGKLFGRDKDLILMKDRIFSASTTLLFAGSGVGKTSFLNAKIIPELGRQSDICYHNRWAGAQPLEALKASMVEQLGLESSAGTLAGMLQPFSRNLRREVENGDAGMPDLAALLKGDKPTRRCLLILDQFEEIFQYHAYQDYFKDFLDELCAVINTPELQVRVVFSMREEFLGELSIFDNRIPDLFNNYYRLKYPDKLEAENIIELTCGLVGVPVHQENLRLLIRDLSKIEKGAATASERASTRTEKRIVERDFIIPPYLQIACQKLWPDDSTTAAAASGNNQPAQPFVFLSEYQANQSQAMLRAFCYEKLDALQKSEKNLAAQAFDFLVTKQGAKMAYELTNLSEHMRVPEAQLKQTLDKLSEPRARILRSSTSPDSSYWYELYHDMYGPIVDDWKQQYRRTKRQAEQRFYRRISAAVLLTFFLSFFIYQFLYLPYQYRKPLKAATRLLDEGNDDKALHEDAFDAHKEFSTIPGWKSYANGAWADHWAAHARLAERTEKRDEALLYRLQALSFEPDAERAELQRREAARLQGDDYPSLLATYRPAGRIINAFFSDDGKLMLSQGTDGQTRVWNVDTPEGETRRVTVLSPASIEQPSAYAWSQSGNPKIESRAGAEAYMNPNVQRMPIVRAVVSHPEAGALFAGFFPYNDSDNNEFRHRLFIWRSDNGKLLDEKGIDNVWKDETSLKIENDLLRIPRGNLSVAFSPDGKYLAAEGEKNSTRLWKVSSNRLEPVLSVRQPGYVTSVAFSPDSKLLLTGSEDKIARLWNLEIGAVQISVPTGEAVTAVVFNPDGKTFLTLHDNKPAQAWETASGEPSKTPIDLSQLMSSYPYDWRQQSVFRDDGLLEGAGEILQQFAIQTGEPKAHGNLLRVGDACEPCRLSPDGKLVTALTRQVKNNGTETKPPEGVAKGGERPKGKAQIWDVATSQPINQPVENIIRVSDDGKFVVVEGQNKQLAKLRDLVTGRELLSLPSVDFNADGFRVSPDGRYLALSNMYKEIVTLWNTTTRESQTLDSTFFPYASFSPDGKYFLATVREAEPGSYNTLKVIDLSSGEDLFKKFSKEANHQNEVREAAFSSDGQLITRSNNDPSARIWNLDKGVVRVLNPEAEIGTGSREGLEIITVGFSPDGKLAFTGSIDGVMRLWDAQTGEFLSRAGKHETYIQRIVINRDANRAVVLTGLWAHLYSIQTTEDEGKALRYEKSRFLGVKTVGAAVDDVSLKLRFISEVKPGMLDIRKIGFEDTDWASDLSGEPSALLEQWYKKLALSLNNASGTLEPSWIENQVPPQEKRSPGQMSSELIQKARGN
ncbi:MAG TPA: WD40 repeat domain-containing protein [Pyrinomonadaceae bacterium]|jgi:WD40 repeat protein